jgi:diaminobutyrate-2-oxoglutarate transaminase
MNPAATIESEVRSYSRSFPAVFDRAQGSYIFDVKNTKYLDFLAGAGTLSYGHNNPVLAKALMNYIDRGGITHGLDMRTFAKDSFLSAFQQLILKPRGMDYRVQFTGPTGTNAIEAAMKIARKVTGRTNIIAFTNGFHGVTMGALAATGNRHHREGAGVALSGITRMPFDGYLGDGIDTSIYLEKMLADKSSGVDMPAAILLETVQGEGGLNVASEQWLISIEAICRKYDVLLIIDDIQAGCGRTGTFFSFERMPIRPDIITLSKALSGFGLPMAVTLINPKLDIWKPGEHNGTFRGNNHAFITATSALKEYWQDGTFATDVRRKAHILELLLKKIAHDHADIVVDVRGRGMMQGIRCKEGRIASTIVQNAFERGLVIETSGAESQVVKCLCPLTIADDELIAGLAMLSDSVMQAMK